MAIDGSLIFNTKMDVSGFNKGINKISSKAIDLKNKIKVTENQISSLQKELNKMENTPFKSDATTKLEKDVAKAKESLNSLSTEADKISDSVKQNLEETGSSLEHLDNILASNKGWQKVQSQIDAAEQKLEKYERELRQAKAVDSQVNVKDTAAYTEKSLKLEELSGNLEYYKAKLQETSAEEQNVTAETTKGFTSMADDIIDSTNWIDFAFNALKTGLKAFQKVAEGIFNTIATGAKWTVQGILKVSEQVGKFTLKQFIGDWEKQGSGLSKLFLTAASYFSVYKLFDLGKEGVALGSNLAEVQNVVDVTFTSMSNSVNEWAKSAASSYGLSETMAKKYVGTFGSMAKAFGFTEKQSYNMATALAGLTGDVASFYNLTQDEAYTKLKSVFSGETESLKDLGVVMTQSALDSYALSNGFGKTTSQMTEAEKVTLRYNFVLNQLKNASGDFTRTQNSWANQTRILQLRWQSLQATMGKALINIFTPALTVLNAVLARLQAIADWLDHFVSAILGDSTGSTGAAVEDLAYADDEFSDLADSAGNAAEAVDTVSDSTADLKDNLQSFDKLNVMDKQNTDDMSISDLAEEAVEASGAITGTVDNAVENAKDKVNDFKLDKELLHAIKNGDWHLIGFIISGKIQSILSKIEWGDIKLSAVDIATNISDFINGAIEGMPWEDIGVTIAEGLNTAILFLATLLEKIDWGEFGKALGIAFKNFIYTFDAQEWGTLVADEINALFSVIGGAVSTMSDEDWKELGTKVGDALYGYFAGLNITEDDLNADELANGAHSISETIGKAIKGIIKAGIALFTYTDPETGENLWSYIGRTLGEGFSAFINDFSLDDAIKFVKSGITAFVNLIYSAFAAISDDNLSFEKLGEGTASSVNKWLEDDAWWEDIGNKVGKIFNDIIDFAAGFVMNLNVDALSNAVSALFGKIDFTKAVAVVIHGLIQAIRAIPSIGDFLYATIPLLGLSDRWAVNVLTNDWNTHGGEGRRLSNGNDHSFGAETAEQYSKDFSDGFIENFRQKSPGIVNNAFSEFSGAVDDNTLVPTAMSNLGESSVRSLGVQLSYDNTASVANMSLSGISSVVETDTSVSGAFAEVGADSQEALTDNFSKQKITSHYSEVLEAIKSIFSNVDVWFEKVFSNAWNKVKNVFSDGSGIELVKMSVENVFKDVINNFIDGLNNAIGSPFETLNTAIDVLRNFEMNSWKPFSWLPKITAPLIPKLATGTVVPANYGEFLAVLGDNKREPEVVSPISSMKQAMLEALAESGFGNNSGGEQEINIYMDGDKIFTVVVNKNNQYKKRTGKSALA